MNRLTMRDENGVAHMKCNQMCADWHKCTPDKCQSDLAIKRLAEYEDAEEQGLSFNLPCKIGDTVYVKLSSYCKLQYAEAKVRDFAYYHSCGFCVVVTSKYFDKQSIPFTEFGKTISLNEDDIQ